MAVKNMAASVLERPAFHSAAFYSENIAIAQAYLKHFQLLANADTICMDCCYFPSHGKPAFYMQIAHQNNRYIGHCAYPYYADYFGIQSTSVNFITIDKAKTHPAKRGDVFCKVIPLDSSLIEKLIEQAKRHISTERSGITIDGVYANVRLFENGAEICNIRPTHDDPVIPLLSAISSLL